MAGTKFKNKRVYLKDMSQEEAEEGIVKGSFKDLGEYFYIVEIEKETYFIPSKSIEWIRPVKSKVLKFKKRLALAK